jgi:hypothetical protein
MRKPALKAATRLFAASGSIGAVFGYGPPPGIVLPEYSVAFKSFVSIQATPTTRLVWTGSGRRYAS